jgi:hypothetical protein
MGRVCKGQRETASGLEFQPELRYGLETTRVHEALLRVERLEDLKSRLISSISIRKLTSNT